MKIISASLLLFICLSCEKEKSEEPAVITPAIKEMEVLIEPHFGEQKLILDSTYTTSENFKIQFSEIKFYLANLYSGGKLLSDAAFFDYRETGNSFLKIAGNYVDYTSLDAILGIDSVRNHSDPSTHSTASPLNIMNAGGMHWGWNPGYIFMKIEARVDTIPDGNTNLDNFVIFHIGKDENKGFINLPTIPWKNTTANLSTARLKVDLNLFLTGLTPLDLKTEYISHTSTGQESLSYKVIQNFANSFSFIP